MLRQINPGETKQEHEEVKREPGQKKNAKSYFGFKVHSKEDCDFGLIWELQTTTASLHDSQVDLSKEGEVVYRDKGYFGNLLHSMQL
jgi:IS5 family transposase